MPIVRNDKLAIGIDSVYSTRKIVSMMGYIDNYGEQGPQVAIYSPLDLFASGEQGAWYDPSDLSTMFQDRAGTTPVTADGQPVGLILDKSKGLVLGSELIADASFDTPASWTPQDANWSVSGGKATYSDGGLSYLQYAAGFTITAGKWYQVNFTISGGTEGYDMCWIGLFNSDSSINLLGEYKEFRTNGSKTVFFYASSSTTGIRIYGNNASIASWSLDSFSVRELPGNHASQATAAARPLYKTDGTYHWLQFDGVDDSLGTGAVDFTGTDKMSVFCGTHNTQNATFSVIIGNGNVNSVPGSFQLSFPLNGSDVWSAMHGSQLTARIFGAPDAFNTNVVLQTTLDLRGIDYPTTLRLNGVNKAGDPSGQPNSGIGNYGNIPLTLGARSGDLAAKYNGNIYSLIVRGALSTTQEITDTEQWIANKTGVTL